MDIVYLADPTVVVDPVRAFYRGVWHRLMKMKDGKHPCLEWRTGPKGNVSNESVALFAVYDQCLYCGWKMLPEAQTSFQISRSGGPEDTGLHDARLTRPDGTCEILEWTWFTPPKPVAQFNIEKLVRCGYDATYFIAIERDNRRTVPKILREKLRWGLLDPKIFRQSVSGRLRRLLINIGIVSGTHLLQTELHLGAGWDVRTQIDIRLSDIDEEVWE